ncbi:hypothetical protein ACQJBY_054417 [Aegilops geniculata]
MILHFPRSVVFSASPFFFSPLIPFLISLFSLLTQKLVLLDSSHQLALLIRCIEVAPPHLKPPLELVLPQDDHRRQLVWPLVRLLRLLGW